MADFADYYEILQVHSLAEPEVIEAAYKRLAQKYHPDKNRSSTAAEKMSKINQAHAVLSDPDKRKEYDAEWVKRKQGPQRQGADKPKPTVEPSYIEFTGVKPGEVKLASFLILNAGGNYKKIWFDNPNSWVRVVNCFSITDADELPLKVEIAAKGSEWNQDYSECIKVRLDDEETQVRIELRTERKPAPSPASRKPRKRSSNKSIWWKVAAGAALVILIIIAAAGFMSSSGGSKLAPPAAGPSTDTDGRPSPPAADLSPAAEAATNQYTDKPTPSPHADLTLLNEGSEVVDTSTIANFPLGSSSLPRGKLNLNGVDFNISGVFMSDYGAASLPVEGILAMHIAHPSRVFVLINTTNTYHEFSGKQAGKITLGFDNGAREETKLFVGKNIREYTLDSLYGNTVRTVTDPTNQMVWQGTDQSRTLAIDMLTIPVSLNNQSSSLNQIVITDTSNTTTDSSDPGLIIWGITVNHYTSPN
jgi:hypothetical protein